MSSSFQILQGLWINIDMKRCCLYMVSYWLSSLWELEDWSSKSYRWWSLRYNINVLPFFWLLLSHISAVYLITEQSMFLGFCPAIYNKHGMEYLMFEWSPTNRKCTQFHEIKFYRLIPHCQNSCLRCLNPRWPLMETQRRLSPREFSKALIMATGSLRSNLHGPVGS